MDQPITRRTFCQLSLAAVCAGAAGARPAPLLRGEFLPRLEGDQIWVELKLYNDSGHPVDVLVMSGSRQAIQVEASWGSWQARMQPGEDQDPRLRSGPRRVWQPIPVGGKLAAGVYKLLVPPEGKGALREGRVGFQAHLETASGRVVVAAQDVRVVVSP